MELSTAEWHQRFLQQARWTESVRRYLLSRMDRKPGFRILETGCGTGAVTQTLEVSPLSNRYGIDWNLKSLQLALRVMPIVFLLRPIQWMQWSATIFYYGSQTLGQFWLK
jgi:ubiquinone/menaquinone biosynthesis C-methylase UbiE